MHVEKQAMHVEKQAMHVEKQAMHVAKLGEKRKARAQWYTLKNTLGNSLKSIS